MQPKHSSVDEDRKKNETETTSKEVLYNTTLWQKRYEIRDEESGTQRHRERERYHRYADISKKIPQILDCHESHQQYHKQPHPLHTAEKQKHTCLYSEFVCALSSPECAGKEYSC